MQLGKFPVCGSSHTQAGAQQTIPVFAVHPQLVIFRCGLIRTLFAT